MVDRELMDEVLAGEFSPAEPSKEQAYREAAARLHEKEGTLEIDDNALVSFGDDPGAYVQAWVWVPEDELDRNDG